MTRDIGIKTRETKHLLYVVLAALLCFIGPTYLVALTSEIIPQIYAMAAGFACFLIGIAFIVLLVRE